MKTNYSTMYFDMLHVDIYMYSWAVSRDVFKVFYLSYMYIIKVESTVAYDSTGMCVALFAP